MIAKKNLGIGLVVIGLAMIVLSLMADVAGGAAGFGWKQITLLAVGAVTAIAGFVLLFQRS